MEMRTYHEPDVAQAGDQKLTFAYDYMGRRVKKEVYGWDSQTSSFKHQASHTFLYDGWSLIREKREIHASSLILHTSYCWGLDLSLTTQGVGGVGGLLSVVKTEADLSTNAYYATADANGNITDYVTETGSVAARFAYDAFGRVISESIAQGLEPKAFTFRFSSKYQDVETGLNYYGFRYYDPELGRWLNRDPIGARGGLNLYGFVGNKSSDRWDYLGLIGFDYGGGIANIDIDIDCDEDCNCDITVTVTEGNNFQDEYPYDNFYDPETGVHLYGYDPERSSQSKQNTPMPWDDEGAGYRGSLRMPKDGDYCIDMRCEGYGAQYEISYDCECGEITNLVIIQRGQS
jgi:RHS repeat-associated protein